MTKQRIVSFLIITALFLTFALPVHADTGDITKVQTFIQSIITVLVTLASLIAAVFFVIGGLGYITSSGNPEHLDRSKKTILYAAIGLAITIGAYVLTKIVTDLATTAFGK